MGMCSGDWWPSHATTISRRQHPHMAWRPKGGTSSAPCEMCHTIYHDGLFAVHRQDGEGITMYWCHKCVEAGEAAKPYPNENTDRSEYVFVQTEYTPGDGCWCDRPVRKSELRRWKQERGADMPCGMRLRPGRVLDVSES